MKAFLGATFVLAASLCASCATTPPPPPASAEAPPVAAEPPVDAQTWRAERPTPGEPPELATPKLERAVLRNGLTVLVSERHDLPLLSIDVAFTWGSASDPAAKEGLANLTYKLLEEGSGARDAIALDAAFAELGTSFGVATTPDGALAGLSVLTRNAEPALALLAETVLRPRLAGADFERKKKEQLADLALIEGNPRELAERATLDAVFGSRHPYGHTSTGSSKSVSRLTLQDAKRFYAQASGPKATALVIVGDTTLAEATAWAEKHFGAWKGTAKRPPAPAVPSAAGNAVRLVAKPGLGQTVITFARPGLHAGAEEEAPLKLASAIFGGFFGSRLNMNLREDKGYSYGAYSSVDARRGIGPLRAGSAVRADVTGASVREFLSELSGIKGRPITGEELRAAREGLIRSLPGQLDTNDDVALVAAQVYWRELPLDRLQRYVGDLEKADLATVQRMAERYFDPAQMHLVLVGDPAVIRQQVSSLGLGELREWKPEVLPGPPAAREKAGPIPAGAR